MTLSLWTGRVPCLLTYGSPGAARRPPLPSGPQRRVAGVGSPLAAGARGVAPDRCLRPRVPRGRPEWGLVSLTEPKPLLVVPHVPGVHLVRVVLL